MQAAIANSRGLFAAHRQTRAEFSITMQQDPAASWAKGNAADVRELDPLALAKRASAKAKLRQARWSWRRKSIRSFWSRQRCSIWWIPVLRFAATALRTNALA